MLLTFPTYYVSFPISPLTASIADKKVKKNPKEKCMLN